MTVQAEIRAELAKQRMTVAELARHLGTTRQNLTQKINAEKGDISLQTLEKIGEILGVPDYELLTRARKEKE